MTKAMIIISAILLFAGVASAGSLSGLGGSDDNTPTLDAPGTAATTTGITTGDVRREDRRADDDEAAEDISGPCDEAEHASDPRCTGVALQADDRGHDEDDADGDGHGRNRGPSGNSGPGGGGHDDD
jgi:hypothetical protein